MAGQFIENKEVALKEKQFFSLAACIVLCWIAAAVCMCVFLAGQGGVPEIAVDDKVNPNHARLESLVRLEGVGPATALQIIEYREQAGGGSDVFLKSADLLAVKGIGPKTVEKIAPWLCFDKN